MWKNPLHIFINSDEDRTSKMAGNINTNRTIFIKDNDLQKANYRAT
jgi:hypothetical protein